MITRVFTCVLLGVALGASAQTLIADASDTAFEHPSISDGGRVITLQRVEYVDSGLCSAAASTDVYLYQHEAGCGRTVLAPFTKDHISLDACPSADGTRIAWRTFDVGTGQNEVRVADVDGTGVQTLFTCAGAMSDLELSPNAAFVVVKVVGRSVTGQAEIIRLEVASPLPDVVDIGPSAVSLGLNAHRCIDNSGVVFYSKSVGGPHDLFKDAPGASSPEPALPPSAEDERNISIASLVEHECLFLKRDIAGVDNLFWIAPSGTVVPVTNNTNPAWIIRQPTISATGLLAAFASTGDFAGENVDGSMEAFSVDLSGVGMRQWSDFVSEAPPLPEGQSWVAGLDIREHVNEAPFHAVSYGFGHGLVGQFCHAASWNSTDVWCGSSRVPYTTLADQDRPETLPPFEAEIVTCSRPLNDPDRLDCDMVIRTSGEGARDVLVYASTQNDGTICPGEPLDRFSPAELSIPAARKATFHLVYDVHCDEAPGQILFDIVSPDSGQPDVARLTSGF